MGDITNGDRRAASLLTDTIGTRVNYAGHTNRGFDYIASTDPKRRNIITIKSNQAFALATQSIVFLLIDVLLGRYIAYWIPLRLPLVYTVFMYNRIFDFHNYIVLHE